jgi:hypothetical protein
MTADEQVLVWGGISYGIIAIIGVALACLFFWCWKRKIAIVFLLGKGREYPRDSQPIKYWCVMLFYTMAVLFILTMLSIRGREWIELLLKLSGNRN